MSILPRTILLMTATGLSFCLAASCDRADGSVTHSTVARGGSPSPGKRVFDRWCAACHADSIRAPGTTALAAKYGKDMPAPLELRQDLTPEVVGMFVRNGVSIMPPFRKTEISDAELAALGRYLDSRSTARRAKR